MVTNTEWDAGFVNGLQPCVAVACEGWRTATTVTSNDPEAEAALLDAKLPSDYSDRDRQIYRAAMESTGNWIVDGIQLTPENLGRIEEPV